ncbi:hypothetical protein EDB85DRAFT_1884847 [Lactarius pseudohatsudake]|nr:hypothetical protein EDB85DRAFT_1897835 [Lactarius pseudohatsudake]KAH9031741.1 hypothetical protein EDB85DRAFT_1890953 [Lactarius pseudohatsudake]KAH9044314.1 hypothetical protein EDB85DRAFT_1884847 [Lactarius pseudohatsudake]
MWPVMGSGYCRFEAFPSLRCSSTQYKLQHSPMTTCPTFPHLQRAPGSRQRRRQHKPWVAHTCDVFCGIVLDAVLTAQARPLFTRIRIFLPGGMDYSHAWQHIVTAHDRHMSTTQVECWIIDARAVRASSRMHLQVAVARTETVSKPPSYYLSVAIARAMRAPMPITKTAHSCGGASTQARCDDHYHHYRDAITKAAAVQGW